MKITLIYSMLAMSVVGCANAESVSWKERGNTVSASAGSSAKSGSAAKPSAKPVHMIKLSTGQMARLTGGVYVKAKDPYAVLAWAVENGHTAKKDAFSSDVVHIESAPSESVALANVVGKLDGVTTAAPNYKVPKVVK